MAIARWRMPVLLASVLVSCGSGGLLWAGDDETWPQTLWLHKDRRTGL